MNIERGVIIILDTASSENKSLEGRGNDNKCAGHNNRNNRAILNANQIAIPVDKLTVHYIHHRSS